MQNYITFVKENMSHVLPVLICGFMGIAIMIERFVALIMTYSVRNRKSFFERLKAYVLADRLQDAIALCNSYGDKPLVTVVREGLMRAHQPEEMISDGLAIAIADANHRISLRTPYLATIANVATLLGLVGTIAGLIAAFEAVGRASASEKSALLAAGISTAMNATMLGLAVAVPCMVAFSFLMNRTNILLAELDQSAIQVMDILRQRFYNSDPKSSHGSPNPDDRARVKSRLSA